MIKFITPKGNPVEFVSNINEVDEGFSPIKEILKKNNFSDYYFVQGENEEVKISLGDCFQLQVNVKLVGVFHFLFKNEGFNKEEVIKQVSALKDLKVDNEESAKYKVEALLNTLKNYNPLFVVYKECDDSYYFSYELETAINNQFPLFIVKVEKNDSVSEFFVGENQYEERSNKPEKKKKATKINKEKLLKELNSNKFSLLLVFVSTVLLQVSIPLAVLNIYSKNALYIFLFICGSIGAVMNGYCYFDYFKNKNIKNPLFLFNVLSNLIGLGIGIGIFAIFYNISTKAEGTPGIGSFIAIGVLVTLILVAATITVIYFIPRKNKAK